jgi:hypothetical protein
MLQRENLLGIATVVGSYTWYRGGLRTPEGALERHAVRA